MKPLVVGLSLVPSIFTTRPRSTVTSSEQQSGQSSGQAVRTVEWPQDRSSSGREDLRGMLDYLTAAYRGAGVRISSNGMSRIGYSLQSLKLKCHHSFGSTVKPS